jgi:hypothetical protein
MSESVCPACGHPVAASDRPGEPDASLVSVLDTADRNLLSIVKVTLDGLGIDCTIDDRGISEHLFGQRSLPVVGETEMPFSVLVRAEDAARARQAVADLGEPSTTPVETMPSDAETGGWPPAGFDTGPLAIDLSDVQTGQPLGSITEEQFQKLSRHLERESSEDDDYYVDAATLTLLADGGVDETVVRTLRAALGGRTGMDVRWRRREGIR